MKASRQDVIGYSVLLATMSAGYGVLFTLIGDYRDAYGIPESILGWIIGVGFIAEFAAQLLIAPLGDRGRARAIVWGGVVINIVGLVIVGFGTNAWLIGLGRLLSGLAGGAVTPVLRRIVVLNDPANVGRNLGWLLSASVFGFASGPAVSAVLAGPFGLAAPFLVVAAVSAVSALVVMRSTTVPEAAAGDDPHPRLALDLLSYRPLIGALSFGAATYAMIGAFDVLWDVVHSDLGTAEWLANLGVSMFALPLIVLAPIGGRAAQTFGPFRLGGAGLLIASAFMFSYGVLPTGVSIVVVSLIHAFTDGFTITSTGVAMAIAAPEDRQAGAQGLLGAAQALTAGLMAPLIGTIYQASGRFSAYAVTSFIMVALVVGGFVLAWPLIRRYRATPEVGRSTVG